MPDDKKPVPESDRDRNPSAPEAPARDRLKAYLVRHLRAQLEQTGRRYLIDLDALDVQSVREFIRLLRDLDQDNDAAVRKARMMPWRGW